MRSLSRPALSTFVLFAAAMALGCEDAKPSPEASGLAGNAAVVASKAAVEAPREPAVEQAKAAL